MPEYGNAFTSFPDGATAANIARAIAAYVRSIQAGDSPVDRYVFEFYDRGANANPQP